MAEVQVNSCDGDYGMQDGCLVWENALVDESNSTGTLEIVTNDPDIYPIEISFSSQKLFCELELRGVVTCADEQPVRFASDQVLHTDTYIVEG